MHHRRTVLHRDLGDLRHVGVVAFHQRHAAEPPGGSRLAPTGHFCRLLENAGHARLAVQQRQAVSHRILAGDSGTFVDEGLVGEGVHVVADRAPVAHPHTGVVFDRVVARRRDVVERHAGFGHQPDRRLGRQAEGPCGDRLRGHAPGHRRGLAISADRRGNLVHAQRPVEVVLHVVFTRPHQPDRLVRHRLGELRGLQDVVVVDAPAEGTTEKGVLDRHVLDLQLQHLGHRALHRVGPLRGADQLDAVALEMGRVVHRLHWRVRQVLRQVLAPHHLAGGGHQGVGVADLLQWNRFARGQRGARAIEHRLGVEVGVGALVPLHREQLARLHGMPVSVGDHGKAVGDLHHVDHAFGGLGLAAIEALDLAALHRRHLDRCVDHVRQLDIHAEKRRAVDLGRCVESGRALADDAELAGVFQGRLLEHRDA